MKLILGIIFSLICVNAYALPSQTAKHIPVTYTSSPTPSLQDGSMYDTGITGTPGNVGIGSVNPGQTLDVQGNIRASGYLYGNGAGITGIIGSISGLTSGYIVKATGSTTIGNSAVLTEANGNIGLNTLIPQSSLTVNGGDTATELVNKGYELIIPSQSAATGSSTEVQTFVQHKQKLIFSYDSVAGGPIYSWDGNTVTQLTSIPACNMASMIEYQGNLYAGNQCNGLTGTVYESTNDGSSWTSVYAPAADYFMYSMAVFQGNLYVGAGYNASRIYQYNGNTNTWSTVYAGLGAAPQGLVDGMGVYKGMLFAGIGNGGAHGGIVSTSNGTTWTQELSGATVTRFMEFRGHLYAASQLSTSPLYVRNDATATWSTVSSMAALNSSGQCWALNTYDNALYEGCDDLTNHVADIYKSYDGVNFFLDIALSGTSNAEEPFASINYNGSMYIGLGYQSSSTGDIWRRTDSVGQQTDWINSIINKFRNCTESGYNWPNDASCTEETAPMDFDSVIRPKSGVNWTDLSGYTNGYVLTATSGGAATFQASSGSGSNYWLQGGGNVGIGTANNVGIGSLNPAANLDVEGTGEVFLNAGAVGIGTLAPLAVNNQNFLAVQNNVNGLRMIDMINQNSGTSNAAAIQAQSNDNDGFMRDYATNNGTAAYAGRLMIENENGKGIGFFNYASNPGDFRFYNGSLVTVLDIGNNVGIGSTAPGQTLDVQGTVRATYFVGNGSGLTNIVSSQWTGTNPVYMVAGTNVGVGSVTPGTQLDVQGTVRALYYTQTVANNNTFAGNIGIGEVPGQALDTLNTVRAGTFISTNSGVSNFNGGNVGIGSASPGEQLDVNGSIRANGFWTGQNVGITTTCPNSSNWNIVNGLVVGCH